MSYGVGVFRCLDQRNRLLVLVGQWRFERPWEVNHSKTEDGRGPFYREIKGERERETHADKEDERHNCAFGEIKFRSE